MKDGIQAIILMILIGLFASGVLVASVSLIDYLTYKDLKREGYNVRLDLWGERCEIQVEGPKGLSWESCLGPGDEFVIKNYAVRSKK